MASTILHGIRVLTLLLVVSVTAVSAEETFPFPEELQPDVDFWVSIFTQYGTDEGVLHDSRDLSVVYERLDMPAELSRRERNRRVKKRRNVLATVLRALATGKRDNLTTEEARVLALWPADVDDSTLNAAADRIRFQQGLADRFRAGLERSGRWRVFIEAEFRALGVPVELAALPHVESSYNPDARSHVGASGIWQFTRSTGRRFMRVDHVVDERNDPFAATRGAGKLLAYNYSIAGNWPMAITAYNHGLSGVRRAQERYGDTAYVDILRNYNGRTFGFASRNFYVAFLAAKEVDQNAELYFPGVVRESPTTYAKTTLQDYVPADELAAALGVSAKQVAQHNPSLQATIWQGSKHVPRGFELRMPEGMLDDSIDKLVAGVPVETWQDKQLPDLYHTIARGDTLSEIAERYETSVSTLVALNGLGSRHRIRAGQRLRLPAAGPAPEVVVRVEEPVVVASVAPPPPAATMAAVVPAAPGPVPEVEEQEPAALGSDLATSVVSTSQTELLSDPSDYTVAGDTPSRSRNSRRSVTTPTGWACGRSGCAISTDSPSARRWRSASASGSSSATSMRRRSRISVSTTIEASRTGSSAGISLPA